MRKKFEKCFSLLKTLANFLITVISISTIHGLNHITKKGYHPVERFIWFVLVTCSAYAILSVSKISLDRYSESPVVISMERDRYSWNTSFPAATICPLNKVDETYLEDYINNASDIKNKELYRSFVMSLENATYENFDQIVEYENLTGEDFVGVMDKFKFKFFPSVSSTIFSDNYNLQMSISELGICYSFNSQLAVYNSPEYWKNGTWKLIEQNSIVYVSPMDGEVFAGLINMSTGFQIYIHGPYELPDIASKNIRSEDGYFLQIYLSGLSIFTSNRAKSLGINQRKCRMFYESNLRHFPVYSYVLCRMECRAKLSQKLCGCIPHFYRKIGAEKICNIKGLQCLQMFKDRLIQIKECACLPNCEDVNFFVDDWDTREWFLGSVLQWGLKDYPKMRLKRDILFGFSDLLVYTGGVAGLFLGCSVLSFIEIFYFITLRLYWCVVRYGA